LTGVSSSHNVSRLRDNAIEVSVPAAPAPSTAPNQGEHPAGAREDSH